MSEPIYELALNPETVRKVQKKLEKTPEFSCLRELTDYLLEKWLKEAQSEEEKVT
jgi:hypothetical protein